MIDWAGGVQSRNSGIIMRSDRRRMGEMLLPVLPALAVFGVLFCYSWMQSRMEAIGYEESEMRTQELALLKDQSKLMIQEELLKTPKRIDELARLEHGLERVRANQILTIESGTLEQDGQERLALAAPPGDPVKP